MPDTLLQAWATPGLIWLLVAIGIAGIVRGFTGFGTALIFVPVAGIFLSPAIVIGVITRSAPTLNIFAFGFPLTMSVTLLLLFLTTSGLGAALSDHVARALQHLMEMLNGLPNG